MIARLKPQYLASSFGELSSRETNRFLEVKRKYIDLAGARNLLPQEGRESTSLRFLLES